MWSGIAKEVGSTLLDTAVSEVTKQGVHAGEWEIRKALGQAVEANDINGVVKQLSNAGLTFTGIVNVLNGVSSVAQLASTSDQALKFTQQMLVSVSTERLSWDSYLAEPSLKVQLKDLGNTFSTTFKDELSIMQKQTRSEPPNTSHATKLVLLWGPPGTGKTYAMRTIAATSGLEAYTLDASNLRSEHPGVAESRLNEVLGAIDKLSRPSIVFFDEADQLLRQRSSLNPYDFQLVDIFASWADGFRRRNDNVVLVLATNHEEAMDPAILSRASPIEVPLPSYSLRLDWWERNARQLGTTDSKVLAERTEGHSFRDLLHLADEAEQEAITKHQHTPDVGTYIRQMQGQGRQEGVLDLGVRNHAGGPPDFTAAAMVGFVTLAMAALTLTGVLKCHKRSIRPSLSQRLVDES